MTTAQAGSYRPFNRATDLKISKVGEMDPREAMKRSGEVCLRDLTVEVFSDCI